MLVLFLINNVRIPHERGAQFRHISPTGLRPALLLEKVTTQ
jgi:hypothetical protein